jgi:peptide/nickel transport system permease protein
LTSNAESLIPEETDIYEDPPFGDRIRSLSSSSLKTLRSNPNLLIGSTIITIMVLIALLTLLPTHSIVTRHDPQELSLRERVDPPSSTHWFGTDALGRDVYSRTMHGSKTSLYVGSAVAILVTITGVTLGVLVGYNRVADNIVMRFMDGMMSFPTLILALALVATLGSSLTNVIIIITIVDTPGMTRVVRAVVLSLRERTYVDAARASGASTKRILFFHVAPNTLAPVIITASIYFGGAILTEAALGFLGVGTPEFIPTWGNIISSGRAYIRIGFWIAFFPGIFLALTVFATNLVGDGLRDVLDPRLRGQE